MIKHGIGKVTLLDASEEMLNKARDKLKDAVKQNIVVDIVKSVMPTLPFEDNSFDVILFSAVRSSFFLGYFREPMIMVNTNRKCLGRPIPRNSMESDHRCTSRIYFDNAEDNVALSGVTETMLTQ